MEYSCRFTDKNTSAVAITADKTALLPVFPDRQNPA
jgi:hypothetical protein